MALLLLLAAVFAVGFIVVYAVGGLGNRTQLQGITLGGAFAFLAAALITAGKHLVVEEEVEQDYHDPEHPDQERAIERIVDESGSRITRKKLLITAGGAAGAAVIGFDALGAACSPPHAGSAINANKMQRNCDFMVAS